MALAPVSQLSIPFKDEFGGYWLKFYVQGTLTPVAMFTDSTGDTSIGEAEISNGGVVPVGFIQTTSKAIFIPWINASYDAYLFPTLEEAQGNFTVNATRIADNMNIFQTVFVANAVEVTQTLERIVATASQTVFPTTNAYTVGNNEIQVAQNGLDLASGFEFTETGTNEITLAVGATLNDDIDIRIGIIAASTPFSGLEILDFDEAVLAGFAFADAFTTMAPDITLNTQWNVIINNDGQFTTQMATAVEGNKAYTRSLPLSGTWTNWKPQDGFEITDFDSTEFSGSAFAAAFATNSPDITLNSQWNVEVNNSGDEITQVATAVENNISYIRSFVSTWSGWNKTGSIQVTVIEPVGITEYARPDNVKSLIMIQTAPGGGGGGAVGAGSGAAASVGGAGGGTGFLFIENPDSTYTVTNGTLGGGGAAGDNFGADATDSTIVSVNTNLLCFGGLGGRGGANSTGDLLGDVTVSFGQSATGADLSIYGGESEDSLILGGLPIHSGTGGGSFWGGKSAGYDLGTAIEALNFGQGGGGTSTNTATSFAGGDGAPGVTVIIEFY